MLFTDIDKPQAAKPRRLLQLGQADECPSTTFVEECPLCALMVIMSPKGLRIPCFVKQDIPFFATEGFDFLTLYC